MPKTDILHLVSDYWLPGRFGGGARYAYEFIEALRRERPDLTHQVVRVEGRRGLPATFTTGPQLDEPTSFRAVLGGCARDTWVVGHNIDSFAFDAALALRGVRGVHVAVLDMGGAWRNVGRLAGALRYRLVDTVFALSHFAVQAQKAPERKSVVIYGGGDHIVAEPRDGSSYSPVDWTFVGRLTPHKGVHVLLEALPDTQSVRVLGPGWDLPYGKRIAALLDQRGGEAVHDPSDDDIRRALRSTGALVLPTLSSLDDRRLRRPELLGLVVLEAAALGVPSLVSPTGSLPEVADLVGGVVVENDQVDGWRTALERGRPTRPGYLPPELHWKAVAQRALDAMGKGSA